MRSKPYGDPSMGVRCPGQSAVSLRSRPGLDRKGDVKGANPSGRAIDILKQAQRATDLILDSLLEAKPRGGVREEDYRYAQGQIVYRRGRLHTGAFATPICRLRPGRKGFAGDCGASQRASTEGPLLAKDLR